jgi:hypothetical protein
MGEDVLPFRMAGDLPLGERTQRDDLAILRPGVLDAAAHQGLADLTAAQDVRHARVLDDHGPLIFP